MQIRCPHCHHPIEVIEEKLLDELSCPSCGSNITLISKDTTVAHEATALGSTARMEPRRLGHFELLDQVGIGGFGAVWKARDTVLDRIVAVKLPRRGQLNASEAEYFLRDARAAAQLHHPNIVSVHEVGRDGDTFFIASDFVDGANLHEWIQARKLTVRESAELVATIADAVQHAHERGVVHRDLKPGNILMDSAGRPHVADFGLAKRETGEITMTVDGQILGTPAYMSPEQARGKAHEADAKSDVYSLGVILFELLTGELPFRGEKRMLIVQILNDDPPSPRKLNSHVPRDLETICLKCLEKEPRKRYASTAALAGDLRKFLGGENIQARRVGRLGRGWRWCKRNKATTFWIGAFVLSMLYPLILGLVGTFGALAVLAFTTGIPLTEMNVGPIDAEGRSVLPGVKVVREFKELHGPADIGGAVFTFITGPTDSKVFRTGANLRVWIELERRGKISRDFEHSYDLNASPEDKSFEKVTYGVLRIPALASDQDGMEYWKCWGERVQRQVTSTQKETNLASPIAEASAYFELAFTTEASSTETSTMGPMRLEPLPVTAAQLSVMQERGDLTGEERIAWERELASGEARMGWGTSAMEFQGTVTEFDKDICLYEEECGYMNLLEKLRRENGLPPRQDVPEYIFRIMCRLSKNPEAQQITK